MSQTMVGRTEGVTAVVVDELADAAGVGVDDFAPLFETVDPDALDRLFAEAAMADHVTVEFCHAGYRITIDGGRVSVESVDD